MKKYRLTYNKDSDIHSLQVGRIRLSSGQTIEALENELPINLGVLNGIDGLLVEDLGETEETGTKKAARGGLGRETLLETKTPEGLRRTKKTNEN